MKFRRDISDWTPEQKRNYDRRAKWVMAGFIGLQAGIICMNQLTALMSEHEAYETVADDSRVPADVRAEYRQAAGDARSAQLPYIIVLEADLVCAAGALLYAASKSKNPTETPASSTA